MYLFLNSLNLIFHLTTYLSNSTKCVKVNDAPSSNIKRTMGVPQGSMLGPLLLIPYINDYPQQCYGKSKCMLMTLLYTDTHTHTCKKSWVSSWEANSFFSGRTEAVFSCLHVFIWRLARQKVCLFSKTNVDPPNVDIVIKGEKTDMVIEFRILFEYLLIQMLV